MNITFDKETVTLATAITGVAFGLLGAVLGVLNTWRSFDRDRVRVRVVPLGYIQEGGVSGVCIEIVNLGFVPITVSQVGFTISGSDKQIIPLDLFYGHGERLPHRLEARTAFTAYLRAGAEKHPRFATVKSAFVTTACGRRFTGRSKSLRRFVELARAA